MVYVNDRGKLETLCTVADLARILQIEVSTLWKRIYQGGSIPEPSHTVAGRKYFTLQQVQSIFEAENRNRQIKMAGATSTGHRTQINALKKERQ